jgi:hypothetical protein
MTLLQFAVLLELTDLVLATASMNGCKAATTIPLPMQIRLGISVRPVRVIKCDFQFVDIRL